MKNILKNYRRRLLNLSANNKALMLLRLSKEMHLDVQELDFLNSESAFSIIQRLLAGKQKIQLCPYADSRFAPVTPVSRQLRQIKRKQEMLFEERGSKELYLGWPFVHGRFTDGTVARCPLLFFPVQLQVNAAQEWELVQDTMQQAHFNQSFLLAYAQYMHVPVAEELVEFDISSLSQDPLDFRTKLYELLKECRLAVHVGRELFADRLAHFKAYKKADFEERIKPGQLHLEQEAVLGIYPQAASYLVADYDELLEREELQQPEDLFSQPETERAGSAQAQHTFTVFGLDASQEVALQQVKQGKSMVVQGPPGTGKSQLICNLVSDFTARGKKVLVVSQKRAALDVVHQRLASKGLADFAALVHDIHADRRNIYQQLQLQVEQVEEYRKQNLALNSIYTDRRFLEVSRGINKCIQTLEAFKQALFSTSRCGWSAKELYLQSNLSRPHLRLGTLYKRFTADTLVEFLPRLRSYLEQAQVFEQQDFVLKTRHSLKGWGWAERNRLEGLIDTIRPNYTYWQQQLSHCSGYAFAWEQLPVFLNALPVITQLQNLLQHKEVARAVQQLVQKNSNIKELSEQVKQLHDLYMVCPAPDAAIPEGLVNEVNRALIAYEQQHVNFFKGIGWAFSVDKKVLKQALSRYNWALTEANVGKLRYRLELREQATQMISFVNSSLAVKLSLEDNPTPMLQKLQLAEQALKACQLLRQLHKHQVLHKAQWEQSSLQEQLGLLAGAVNNLQELTQEWLQWLPGEQVMQLLRDDQHKEILLKALQQHFETLVAYDTAFASFSEAEKEVVQQVVMQKPESAEEGVELFLNGLYLHWLQDLEQQEPVLRLPSSGELHTIEQELQQLLAEKSKLSQEIVLSRLREQTYRNITYNRLGNAVTYRRLQAQVSKKRSLYPIRKLLALFGEEVLDLVPCWLCSPETVSAIMPLQAYFDLVIFDEASQCFAETGIPGIMRGKQVVVAGDEQQLKPTDIYRTRWATAEDEEEFSAESLLQLCNLYLPNVMLTQHYRSQYPELIDFSNSRFYKGKLELVPHRHNLNAATPAIAFIKVNGLWKENCNVPEAARVVELVLEQLKTGQTEIGVITFNYPQQQLILDLLEEQAMLQQVLLPEALVVKNIENIQGDEKDLIILSVGYAPNEQGRVVAQFGSLSQAGGENRLNVAVTRARKQVLVVSSIYAEELQVDAAVHAGPKLLKEYLAYTRAVSEGKYAPAPRQVPMPAHYPSLKEKLAMQLPLLKQELPFADLSVKQEQKYMGVVLTDDDLYYSQPSVRHHHADLPKQLQEREWPYCKVYSREYWADAAKVLERLKMNVSSE
ncbi:AAA domain-containing protein [Pontibacter sp. SGAir0037]|uniref:AAA domain-containing protein n=1 Tax=Pontibacter sp. SGAir0037 TaxID=2571030 RepID=UPI0010CD3EAE|nr:AAA domain-containing protein [Pontibacter sp. SGAir0037]QCR24456.1 DNA helicase I [Pontibacter sp. SGAir0037]